MSTATLSVNDFLLARIAEDERDSWEIHDRYCDCVQPTPYPCDCNHPARVLADCAAKRRIVALHYVGDPDQWDPAQHACRLCQWDEDCDSPKHDHQHGAGRFPCETLRLLAFPYAGHPDYNEDWRP